MAHFTFGHSIVLQEAFLSATTIGLQYMISIFQHSYLLMDWSILLSFHTENQWHTLSTLIYKSNLFHDQFIIPQHILYSHNNSAPHLCGLTGFITAFWVPTLFSQAVFSLGTVFLFLLTLSPYGHMVLCSCTLIPFLPIFWSDLPWQIYT